MLLVVLFLVVTAVNVAQAVIPGISKFLLGFNSVRNWNFVYQTND